jgi:hypothetical protein
MTTTYSGQVSWANGVPSPKVEVRLFEPGNGQSMGAELTLQPGVSIADGTFTLQIKDTSHIDSTVLTELEPLSPLFNGIHTGELSLGSDSRPLLQFTYPINGRTFQTLVPFRKLHRSYQLPLNPPVDFLPSRDGFNFLNYFKPFKVPISLPAWLNVNRIPGSYGLCGGMSSAAYDFRLARASNPNAPDIRKYSEVPNTGTLLHRYLLRRSLDTFGTFGIKIAQVSEWTLLPDSGLAGIQKLTLDGLSAIRQKLEDGQCVVISLIYEHASDIKEVVSKIWLNHQVLAYELVQKSPDNFEIKIYDSNHPNRDDVVVDTQRIQVGNSNGQPVFGLASREVIPGDPDKVVRGFFTMDYQPTYPKGL